MVACVQRQTVNVEIGGAGGDVEFNSGVKGGEGEGVKRGGERQREVEREREPFPDSSNIKLVISGPEK